MCGARLHYPVFLIATWRIYFLVNGKCGMYAAKPTRQIVPSRVCVRSNRYMYFYLSFLRPPPQQSYTHNPISLTPQIANDLRTELYQHAVDIFYTWHLTSPASSDGGTVSIPVKLTKWHPDQAYKVLKIPPPPNVRHGQHWSLALHTSPSPASAIIDLTQLHTGSLILPVFSSPISFVAESTRGGKNKITDRKQERIRRIFSLALGNDGNENGDEDKTLVNIEEHTSFELDKVRCS